MECGHLNSIESSELLAEICPTGPRSTLRGVRHGPSHRFHRVCEKPLARGFSVSYDHTGDGAEDGKLGVL